MEVCENKLEAGSLSCGHTTDLVQGSITIQDILYPNAVKISSQEEVYFIIILGSYIVNCVYNMINSFFFVWASWGNIYGCYTNPFNPL